MLDLHCCGHAVIKNRLFSCSHINDVNEILSFCSGQESMGGVCVFEIRPESIFFQCCLNRQKYFSVLEDSYSTFLLLLLI